MDSSRDMAQDFLEQPGHGVTFIKSDEIADNSHGADAQAAEIDQSGVVSASSQSSCAANWEHMRNLTYSFLGDELPRPDLLKHSSILEEDNFLNISNGSSSMPGFKSPEETSEENFGFRVLETFSLHIETGGFSQGSEIKPFHELSAEGFYRCGYKAGACCYNTQIPAQLEMHLHEAHQGTAMFTCVHCGSVETTCDGFLQHFDQHLQLKYAQLSCLVDFCDFSASAPEELLAHLITHDFNLPLVCWRCGQEFESLKDILAHVKENLLQIVQCPHCSATDVDRKRIVKHISVSHPGCCRMVNVHKVLICQERMLTGWWDHLENQTVAGTYMVLEDKTRYVPHQKHGSVHEYRSAEKDKTNIPVTTQNEKPEPFRDADLCQEKKIGIIQPLTIKTDKSMSTDVGNLPKNESKLHDSFCCEKSNLGSPRSKMIQKCAPDSLKMKCRFCDMVFPEEYYIRHIYNIHQERFSGFACTTCDFISIDQDTSNTHRCTTLRQQPKSKFSLLSESLLSQHVEEEFVQNHKSPCHKRKLHSISSSDESPQTQKKHPKIAHESTKAEKNAKTVASFSVPRKSCKVLKGKLIHCRLCGIRIGYSKWGASLHIYKKHPEVLECPICKFCPVNQQKLYKHLTDYHLDVRDSLYQKMNVRKYLDFQGGTKQKADDATNGGEGTGISALKKPSGSPQLRNSLVMTCRKSHSECTACWPKSFKTSSAAGNKAKSKTKLFNGKAELTREQTLEHSSCRTRGIDAWREGKTSDWALETEPSSPNALHSTNDEVERVPSPKVFPTEMEYRCPHCVTILKTSDRFYSHLCYHYHYKLFKCGYCTHRAFSKNSVINHISSLHPEHSTAPKVEQVIDSVKENRCHFQMEKCYVPVSQPYDKKRLKKMQDAGKIGPITRCSSKITSSTARVPSSRPEISIYSSQSMSSIKKHSSSQAKISKVIQSDLPEESAAGITDEKEILVMCPYCRGERKALSAVEREIMGHLSYQKYSCHYCSERSCSEIKIKAHMTQKHLSRPVIVDIKISEHKEQRVAILMKKALEMSKTGKGKKEASKNKPGSGNILSKQTVLASSKTRRCIWSEDSGAVSIEDGILAKSVTQQKQGCSSAGGSFRPRDYFTVFRGKTVQKVQCLHCSLVLDTKYRKFSEICKRMGKHVYAHMPRIYPCQVCGQRFYPMSALSSHMKTHQRAPLRKPLLQTQKSDKRVGASVTGIRPRDLCVVEMHGNRVTRRCLRCDFHIQGAVGDKRIFNAMKHHLYKHMKKTIQCFYCSFRSYPCFKVKSHIRRAHRGKPIKWKMTPSE